MLYVSIAFATLLAIGSAAIAVKALRSSSVRKINSLALRIVSLEETVTVLHSVIEALNQRDRMRRVRAASTSSDGSADTSSDPKPGTPGWKAWARRKYIDQFGRAKHGEIEH